MILLSCQELNKSFGGQVVIKDGSFNVQDKEKAALVGINGAGKSTILKMIMKEEPLDGGNIVTAKDKTLGYLSQTQHLNSDLTVYEEVLTAKADIVAAEEKIRSIEKELKFLRGERLKERLDAYDRLTSKFESENGYAYKSEITGVLKGLGFSEEDFGKKTSTLSGGQKTRVTLGKLLLKKPDMLLLDEPTNHLDLNSVSWLETYLINYQGAVLIVSHDRFFINRIVSKVIEIENGRIYTYSGNYSEYAQKKQQMRDAVLKNYLNQQREIRRQEAVIEKLRSFNREKSIRRAESREKLLSKIIPAEKPAEAAKEIHFSLEPSVVSGNDVLSVQGLSKRFGSQILFENADIQIKRGEHVAIIGDNGTGKTTLLKILNHMVPPDAGMAAFGSKVKVGYYDQEYHVLHPEKNIFDEISDDYPGLDNTKIRNTLAAFQFTGDDVYKLIGSLSGGEKGRVSLAKLMLSEANFLMLDEPTNHLDITSKEILEKALNEYTGTVLYVSHDRYFINKTASRILELVNCRFVNYLGNYDYYLEKKEAFTAIYASDGKSGMSPDESRRETSVKADWQEQKERQAKKRKREGDFKRTEELISSIEERNRNIDLLMAQGDVYTDPQKCQELSLEKSRNDEELASLYKKWEELAT